MECFYLFAENNFFMLSEQKAQVSIELIIVLAAVVALVLLFVTQLQKTGAKGTQAIEETSDKIFGKIGEIQ